MVTALDKRVLQAAREIAAAVPDPELPMVTVADLGILRDVAAEDGRLVVTITPTYSGCPALREIAHDMRHRLSRAGFGDVTVRIALAPAWSSDWITAAGRRKLHAAGIAPPHPAPKGPVPLTLGAIPSRGTTPGAPGPSRGTTPGAPGPSRGTTPGAPGRREPVPCPRCGSRDTTQTAAFSATACKALFRCEACREPFEYVKEI